MQVKVTDPEWHDLLQYAWQPATPMNTQYNIGGCDKLLL